MVSVNHRSLTYMVTSISNYVAAIVALGLIFNKMHHYAAHYLPSQILSTILFYENQCFYTDPELVE